MKIYLVSGVKSYGLEYSHIFTTKEEALNCARWHNERGDSAFVSMFKECEYIDHRI